MNLTDALCNALLATGCGLSFGFGSICIEGRLPSGRKVNVIVTGARVVAHVCNTGRNRDDGYEMFRIYGAPEATITEAMARLSA